MNDHSGAEWPSAKANTDRAIAAYLDDAVSRVRHADSAILAPSDLPDT